MIIDAFVREKMVNTTHEWIAYKSMEKLPNNWKNLFLKNVEVLLDGSRAPDRKFHDFRNHIFHPLSWGGAPDAALEWYNKFVDALKKKIGKMRFTRQTFFCITLQTLIILFTQDKRKKRPRFTSSLNLVQQDH